MGTIRFLEKIRPLWIDRVSHRLARGEGVRENFLEELNRFFDLLLQAVDTGDPAWLEPLLAEWATAQTQTNLERSDTSLTLLLSQILLTTNEVSVEVLGPDLGSSAFSAMLPVFTHAIEHSTQRELDVRIGQIVEELRSAQEELERLDRSKSAFISVAAHELKTPLTLLEGYISMIREYFPQDDESSQPILLLKGMNNGTRRLREIVDDMIDVSLIDNDMLKLNFQPIWLNRLFNILAGELQSSLAERQQTLQIEPFPGFDQMTFGDSERLYQAFRNLLQNAIKYTPNEGEITVRGRQLPGFIEVTITDTGIGIDPQDQTRIFDKFGSLGKVQYHSSGKTKFKGGGPGLGLPITKGIIEAHGGTIWVESEGYNEEERSGSTFHVLLPLREAPPDTPTAEFFGLIKERQAIPTNPASD